MLLRTTDPFRDFDRLTQQLLGTTSRPAVMPMDAWREGDRFVIEFDLPGVAKETIDLDVERNVLTVRAERVARNGDWEMLATERPRGAFSRQLVLGDNLDLDRIEASYDAGVLRLVVPVAEKAKPRKIEIGGDATTTRSRAAPSGGHRGLTPSGRSPVTHAAACARREQPSVPHGCHAQPQIRTSGPPQRAQSTFWPASRSQVSTTVSGLSDIDSMPCSSSHSARSGWSEGPWPQMPTYLPCLLAGLDGQLEHVQHRRVALVEAAGDQAGVAVDAQGQLGHVVGADREAVEVLQELVGDHRVGRDLAHHHDLEVVLAALEPVLGRAARSTPSASARVRTNGIITQTLVSPMSSRTCRSASHSIAKQSANSSERYRDAPR